MDKPREGIAKKKLIRRIIMGVVALAVIGSASYVLGNLTPVAPTFQLDQCFSHFFVSLLR